MGKNNITIIGVAGGSASGKSTIVDKLKREFKNDIVVLCHDYYYKAHPNLMFEERAKLNYDHPNSYDTDMLIDNINDLIEGKTIKRPVYDYANHDRSDEEVIVKPKKVIVIDGILILECKELRDLMDIKIFVDTDDDIRLIRRIRRDTLERGRSIESVLDQYEETVKPMHDQFVAPSKRYADIIVPIGGENDIAIEMIVENVKKRING